MSMSDPIADMLARIRNAQAVYKASVCLPTSKIKLKMIEVLQNEGYIESFENYNDTKNSVTIKLKYHENKPVIAMMKRISKPGLRVYASKNDIPRVIGGMGIVIMSTPKGVMTGQNAYKLNVGGELLCSVY